MDDAAGVAAGAPPLRRAVPDTSCGSSRDTVLPPATRRRLPLGPGLRSAPRAGCPARQRARFGKAHVATRGARHEDRIAMVYAHGGPTHAPHPRPGTPPPTRPSGPVVLPHASYVVVAWRTVQGDAQDLGGFFLDLEDRVRLLQPSTQTGVFLAQLLVLDGDLVAATSLGSPRLG